MLAVASAAAASTSAHAHYRPPYFQACVAAKFHTWLFRCEGCREPVNRGRAFRVERQHGGHLLVWNLEMHGWVHLAALNLAPQSYCRAAGI